MFKNIIIIILFLLTVFLWIGLDVESQFENDDTVTISYDCNKLSEYINVPEEVKKECDLRLKK